MSERQQPEEDQDPGPTKHADAQRITEDESQRVPTSDEDQSQDAPTTPTREAD
jgi:hypothetical protein